MTEKTFEGYVQAEIIDKQISKLMKEHKITHKNVFEFMKFARTIRTTCELIEMQAHSLYKRLPK